MSGVQFPFPGKVAGEGWRSGGACVGSVVKSRKTCLRVVCEPHIWLSLALVCVALSRVTLPVDARTKLARFYCANKVKWRSRYLCCKMKKKKEAKTIESSHCKHVVLTECHYVRVWEQTCGVLSVH